jgi:predicted RNA-binding Zn-ribbon protein involved in translation (DUF1610 family)
MEFRFYCPSCGCRLKADEQAAGMNVNCPDCGVGFFVPQPERSNLPAERPSTEPPSELPAAPATDAVIAIPNPDGEFTCPVCWLHFDGGDIMHIAVHDSLRGDPILGEDA